MTRRKIDMEGSLKIMAVVCHPADAVDMAGGTLCIHALRGDEVTVVICTHGTDTHNYGFLDSARQGEFSSSENDHYEKMRTKYMEEKENEIKKAMSILEIKDVRFLRFPDQYITVNNDMVYAIAKVMNEVKPHFLVLHNPTEELGYAGVGHAETAISSLKARNIANSSQFIKESPDKRTFPSQVFFSIMDGETNTLTAEGARYGNVLVDITSVIDRKVRALDCIQSQYYRGDVSRKCIEIVNGRMGLHWRFNYAEAFNTLNPDICSSLPVNEMLLAYHEKDLKENIEHMKIMVTDI